MRTVQHDSTGAEYTLGHVIGHASTELLVLDLLALRTLVLITSTLRPRDRLVAHRHPVCPPADSTCQVPINSEAVPDA